MSIDPEQIRLSDETMLRLDAFMRSQHPSDEETGRFYHIVTVITDATRSNYMVLRQALTNNDQTAMAWACRNLLELSIFAKFVIRSKTDADEFAADRLIDGVQIGVSLKRLELSSNPGLKDSAFDAVIEGFAKQMKEQGVTRKTPLNVRNLAKELGVNDDYEAMNKICSKLVHPTSWSLFTAELGVARFPEAQDLLFLCGAQYAATVYAEIAPHIRKWGLRHQP